MKITVFTPTYNRGYIIHKLYQSLTRQTFKDFEWLIIDDGSTDDTEEIIKEFIDDDSDFPIRYYKVENGGKHRAINRAVKIADGELFFIVDSDDHIPDNSLELIIEEYNRCTDLNLGGLFGLRCHNDGSIIGKTFKGDSVNTNTILAGRHNIRGDKGEVFVTDVLKEYPYPEFDEENFCTESIVWDRMSKDGYIFRYFNKWICTCEYLEDGLTHQGWNLYIRNPKQWGISLGQNYRYGKYGWYSISCQIYVLYIHLKDKLTISEISEISSISRLHLFFSIMLQKAIDIIRRAMGKPQILKSKNNSFKLT